MEPRFRRAHDTGAVLRDVASDRDNLTRRVVTLSLEGELDAATAPEMAATLAQVVRPGCRVVLDMSAVRFLDCAGLSELLRAQRRAGEGGGWIKLTWVQSGPLRMLELTGTADLLLRRRIPEQRDREA